MEEFNTIEKVEELFRNVNGLKNSNNFFLTYVDTKKSAMKYGLLGGAAGALGGAVVNTVSAVAATTSGIADGMNRKSDGYLINYTEAGLGMIPLDAVGIMLSWDPTKLKADVNAYYFIENKDIANIIVKNSSIFNSKVKSIKITLTDGKKLDLLAKTEEKLIPYHANCFTQFAEKFKK